VSTELTSHAEENHYTKGDKI